jgi:hypothetical protein
MKRIHFIEISDKPWCPQGIKDAVTDFCRFILDFHKAYKPVAPLLAGALRQTGSHRILDLCSGAAGPWTWLQPLLRDMGVDATVCLSDHYPNPVKQRSRSTHGMSPIQGDRWSGSRVPATAHAADFYRG